MEEGDKSIGVGEETATRVSDGSPSWLFAKRQRFTIELRPGETTIVSWKRLVKDAHNTSPPLTARNTEDSLDECFQDDKSTSKQNGLLVNSDKLECTSGTVLSVALSSRKRRKNMAKVRGEKVDDLVPCKHAKVEQGRLDFAATNAVLKEQSTALLLNSVANIGTKSEHSSCTEVSNKDAFISPSNSKVADKYRSVTTHSSDLGNNTNSLATHQKHLEKRLCKKHKSPVRNLMTENSEERISTEVEKKRETCAELPDLNLPVYSVQSERNLKEMILMEIPSKQRKAARFQQIKLEVTEMIKLQVSKLGDVATGDIPEVLGSEEKVVLKKQYCMDNIMEDKICDLYDLYIQFIDGDKSPQIRKLYVELAELWPNGIMDKYRIKNAICRAKERKMALWANNKVREARREKSAQKVDVGVQGEACSVSQLQAVQENQDSASSSHILALPCRRTSCKETPDQHLANVPPNSGLDISEEGKIEKMTISSSSEQMKQKGKSKNRVKKLSMKLEKETRKSHKAIGHPDAASYELAAPPSCGNSL
ncbi:hypothetical protein V6N12_021273 [Hibiscus sabdariffa]|uniref:Uncharacterized protein n=1 Tax=Hibiscus sabdariffa TaxID=183260 RepID=A0ABR2FR50_9ROSI